MMTNTPFSRSLHTAFHAAVKRLVDVLREAARKIHRECRRLLLTWHLRRLDHADARIWASLRHERRYLETMESDSKILLMTNNRRRYSLQRRLIDLDREA